MCMTWRFHFPLRNYDFKNVLNNLKKHGFVQDGKDILSLHVDNFYTAECLIHIERKIKRYALNSKINANHNQISEGSSA